MSLLNWSTALWFLLLIPAVIILYFLRLRRNEVMISSSLLWSRALEDRRANAPFQKLRNSLLMFLQLIAIALMVMATVLVGVAAGAEFDILAYLASRYFGLRSSQNSLVRFDVSGRVCRRVSLWASLLDLLPACSLADLRADLSTYLPHA